MLNPPAVIAQARSGSVPAAWRVLRPRGAFPVLAMFRAIGYTLFAVIFLSILSAVGIGFASGDHNPTPVFQEVLGDAPVLVAGAVGIILLFGIVALVMASSTAPYSFFVLTQEGIVQSTGQNAITALDFANIDHIAKHIQINVNRTTNASTGATTTSSSTTFSAEVRYKDGRTIRWRPNWRFGADQSLVDYIVSAFQQYTARVAPGGRVY